MGFQHVRSIIHKAASSKGGKIRGKKGLAAMSPEKRREIQSKGGKARHVNNNRTKAEQTPKDTSKGISILETILGDLDENSHPWTNTQSKEQ